ncbi:MAG: RdgB/HAM1 family non-canonical purine NTP pyrophosphatase [Desulfovibrio sp.]|nr:RdgB/HAM1 family non-canonical purine NTP pyrophosphatase [Desulfovibrio sp.]
MPRDALVLATRNTGKLAEISFLLSPLGLPLRRLPVYCPEVEETGETFTENALLKARAAAAATRRMALADDSGLEVDALNGAPGIYSARYGGCAEAAGSRKPSLRPAPPADGGNPTGLTQSRDARNREKLLAALAGVPPDRRTARFRCVMAACAPDGLHLLAEGVWEGVIAAVPNGGNGFGYDPLFFDPLLGCTAAALSPEEKNRHSHRSRAAAALLRAWPAFWLSWLARRPG